MPSTSRVMEVTQKQNFTCGGVEIFSWVSKSINLVIFLIYKPN